MNNWWRWSYLFAICAVFMLLSGRSWESDAKVVLGGALLFGIIGTVAGSEGRK
jgi:hypothetical protein